MGQRLRPDVVSSRAPNLGHFHDWFVSLAHAIVKEETLLHIRQKYEEAKDRVKGAYTIAIAALCVAVLALLMVLGRVAHAV